LVAQENDGLLLSAHHAALAHRMPERYLFQALQPLVRVGILHSKKGPGGGYRLARPPRRITLLEVVEAVDGPLGAQFPHIQGKGTDALEGRLREVWAQVIGPARKLLGMVSLAQLAGTARPRGEE
jgi:Rrf2 family protein